MKRSGNLWPQVVAYENLHRAAYRVLRGKRGQIQAANFFFDLERELFRLKRELEGRTYQPGGYRTFWISDPKPRMISAAPFRDRVIHHALVNVIEPVFERRFVFDSYACRAGKGTHRALERFVKWSRSARFVLKLDIRKFFPSLDHEILKRTIRGTIKDQDVLWLCDSIIDHSNEQEPVLPHFPGDDLLTPLGRKRGIPIGNLTSQFFANVVLDPLDHFIKERLQVKKYLRYVDDFCIFHDDKNYLTALRGAIAGILHELRLRLNEGKSRVRQLKEGIEFLGFVILPDRIRLNRRAISRQRTRMRSLQRAYSARSLGWEDVEVSLMAWNAHASYGNSWRLRSGVLRSAVFSRDSPSKQRVSGSIRNPTGITWLPS